MSPSVGTLSPGQRLRVQLTFGPTLKNDDIEGEAFEAAKNRILDDIEKKKEEDEADRPQVGRNSTCSFAKLLSHVYIETVFNFN